MAKLFKIVPDGRLGNLMFQYMFAKALEQRVPGLQISGVDIKEWGLREEPNIIPPDHYDPNRTLRLQGHSFNFEKLVQLLNFGQIDCIEFAGLGCRAEYYKDRKFFSTLFPTPSHLTACGYSDEYLVVNVRAEDILSGTNHCDYMPTPIPFIRAVLEKTGLKPVFMGQIGDDWYSNRLRAEFPTATFLKARGAIGDFELIRQSKNILIPVSTFSWLASWLSESNRRIYMPILGLYNPAQRPDINLVPKNDSRYRYYQFQIMRWSGDPRQLNNAKFEKTGYLQIKMQEQKGKLIRYVKRAYSWFR